MSWTTRGSEENREEKVLETLYQIYNTTRVRDLTF